MKETGSRFAYLFRSAESRASKEYGRLLAPLGLTPNQAEVIRVLDQYGPLSLKGLGELLICEEKSPSRLVQALIKKDLVHREISSQDKRRSLLSLTEAGQKLARQVAEQEAFWGKELEKQVPNLAEFSRVLEAYLAGSFYEDKLRRRSFWPEEK
ncbi:MarR family winged helix-turn-helix transcriptional regulator [Streptococcus oricebi]|uniref:MarR family transcriptional regulator n=1 Tax=Streptococcus oricebi TaxID=1547447 RepID=A0ABS5B4K6_9STRE|nr:winged helix DNA-binding protein [Streptococcus oricebi]MBP2623768.1 MarR family transcriptional regulator [Streptococcus oricebi]